MYVPQDLQAVNGLIGNLHIVERICKIFECCIENLEK